MSGPCCACAAIAVVGQLLHEARLPVVLQAGRHQRVERAVQRRVRHRPHELGDDRRHVVERLERRLALLERSRPARHHRDERVAVPVLGDERQRRRDLERGERAERLRSVRDVVAEELEHVRDLGELEEHRAAVDVLDRVQPELERRHDAVVPAAAPQRPEQVGVLAFARHLEPAVGGDDVGRDQVVQRQPEPTREVADPAAEREPADAGGRDDAAGGRQAERIRGGVEVAPRRAALGSRRAGGGIDPDAAHAGQVDHDPAVARPEPRHAVAAAAHGEVEPVLPSEVDRRHHVARVRRANDRGRAPVDHGVVDGPRLLVPVIVGSDDRPADQRPQVVQLRRQPCLLLRRRNAGRSIATVRRRRVTGRVSPLRRSSLVRARTGAQDGRHADRRPPARPAPPDPR